MAQQIINTGAVANDGTGDPLRTAFTETNSNFTEIYTAGPVGSNVRIANNTILTINTNGNLVLAPNGVGVVQSNVNIVPNQANVRNLGSSTARWGTVYAKYVDITNGTIYSGDLTVTGNLSAATVTTPELTVNMIRSDDSTVVNIQDGVEVDGDVLVNGNVTADYVLGDGSQLTGIVSSYGNPNVATFLAAYGSNTVVTTGNVTAGNVLTSAEVIANGVIQTGTGFSTGGYLSVNGSTDLHDTNIIGNLSVNTIRSDDSTIVLIQDGVEIDGDAVVNGNVTGAYILGNGSQLTGLPAIYGNANVTALLSNLGSNVISGTGNITTTANVSGAYVKGNGSELTNLPAPTVTQDITSTGDMSIMTYDGVIKSVNYATVEPSSGNIKGGNITTTGLVSATGNITAGNLNSPTLNSSGNISVVASGNTWTFGTDGSLTLPIGVSIDSSVSPVYPKIIADSGKLFSVQGQGNTGSAALAWTVDPDAAGQYASVGVTRLGDNLAKVILQAQSDSGNVGTAKTWQFNETGNLILPGGSTIDETVGIKLAPAGGADAGQALVIYPTGNLEGDHIHLAAYGANTELYLGTDDHYVKLANTGNVVINSNDGTGNSAQWTFGANGNLTVPGGIVGSGASPAPYLSGFSSVSAITVSASGNISATGNVTGGNVLTGGVISSTGNITGGNISATNHTGTTVSVTGNITAANFFGNGNTLSNVATRFESSWTVPVGNSTQSFTVAASETYYLWVDCNIPNGILVWNATATVTNTNVPVVGQQFAWVYNGNGTPIDFTSIPNQFVGTADTIVRGNVAPSATTNRFDFGINNTSAGNVTVRYGWIQIS